MRWSQHNRITNRKGSDRKGSRGEQKQNKGDKKIRCQKRIRVKE